MFHVANPPTLSPPILTHAALTLLAILICQTASAEQRATMSVSVIARGEDSTKSEGEWSKGSFSYYASFTATLDTDGEPGSVNMHDPEYGEKAMAQAQLAMEKVQNAMEGKFSDEEEVEAEARFLLYTGQLDCPATVSVKIEEKVEGAYADVGGMQPYTQTFTAESTGNRDQLNMLCVGSSSTLDIKDNILYRSALGFPGVTGHYVFNETNRGNIQDDRNAQHKALPTIVSDWVFNTLRVAPVKGTTKTTLTPTEPVLTRVGVYDNYKGKVDVEITWDWIPGRIQGK